MANIDDLKFEDGDMVVKRGEDTFRIAQPDDVPDEVFEGVEQGFMRQSDYTKKTQKLSEFGKRLDGLESQFSNDSAGPNAGQNSGQQNGRDASTAPGGASSSFASPEGSGNGQAGGTNDANGNSSPNSDDFNFESLASNSGNNNNQNQNGELSEVKQMLAQVHKENQEMKQQLAQQQQQSREQQRIEQMQGDLDNFDPNTIRQEIQSLPDDQKQEYANLPMSTAMELYHRRNIQNQGGQGNDAANRQPAQNGGPNPQGENQNQNQTPYAASGNTSGPSGSPQGNEVVSDTEGIADHINEIGLGDQTEDQASLGKRPG